MNERIPTLEEWRQLLTEFVSIGFPNGNGTKYVIPNEAGKARELEIRRLCTLFEEHSPKYRIICKKACYVGQGIDFAPGDVVDTTSDPDTARRRLAEYNKDPWAIDCFELATEEPKHG